VIFSTYNNCGWLVVHWRWVTNLFTVWVS